MASTDIVDIWAKGQDLPDWFNWALSVPREEGFVEIDGAQIHYFRWGKKGHPPLLITHGFLAHKRCFAFIAPFLAEDYDIVAYDMANMGDSGERLDADNAQRAREMIGVADAMDLFSGPVKPNIVAHSFGSGVGLTAMEQAGDRFAGLIICDLMVMRPEKLRARWEKEGEGRPGNGNTNRPNKVYPDYETARGRYVLSPPQPVGTPFLMEYMAYHSLQEVEGGWSWKFSPQVFKRDEADQIAWMQAGTRIGQLRHRCAIIYGADSKLFDADSAAFIREEGGADIPIIAVPEAEHHLMLDQPLAFVSALRSVLACWR